MTTPRNYAIEYQLAMSKSVTSRQYAEWNGRKLWDMFGSGSCTTFTSADAMHWTPDSGQRS